MQLFFKTEDRTLAKYTPDWIQICVNNKEYTFDIHGTVYYHTGFNCHVNGNLELWTVGEYDKITNEYFEQVNPEIKFSDSDISTILKNATEIVVGVYSENFEEMKKDVLSEGVGVFQWFDKDDKKEKEVQFTFTPELNV